MGAGDSVPDRCVQGSLLQVRSVNAKTGDCGTFKDEHRLHTGKGGTYVSVFEGMFRSWTTQPLGKRLTDYLAERRPYDTLRH